MNKKKFTIAELNAAITAIEKAKVVIAEYEEANGFIKTALEKGRGTWIIEDRRYYQFVKVEGGHVTVNRKGLNSVMTVAHFNSIFRLAEPSEVEQHERYLRNSGGKQLTDTEFVGYKLMAKHADKVKAVEALTSEKFPASGYITENSAAWRSIVTASVQGWFEKALEKIKVAPSTSPAFDPKGCEFYMVTCKGIRGATYRHTDYDEAVAQAQSIANKERHQAWVVGVVTSVQPQ